MAIVYPFLYKGRRNISVLVRILLIMYLLLYIGRIAEIIEYLVRIFLVVYYFIKKGLQNNSVAYNQTDNSIIDKFGCT